MSSRKSRFQGPRPRHHHRTRPTLNLNSSDEAGEDDSGGSSSSASILSRPVGSTDPGSGPRSPFGTRRRPLGTENTARHERRRSVVTGRDESEGESGSDWNEQGDDDGDEGVERDLEGDEDGLARRRLLSGVSSRSGHVRGTSGRNRQQMHAEWQEKAADSQEDVSASGRSGSTKSGRDTGRWPTPGRARGESSVSRPRTSSDDYTDSTDSIDSHSASHDSQRRRGQPAGAQPRARALRPVILNETRPSSRLDARLRSPPATKPTVMAPAVVDPDQEQQGRQWTRDNGPLNRRKISWAIWCPVISFIVVVIAVVIIFVVKHKQAQGQS